MKILENNLERNYIKLDGKQKTYSEVVAENIKATEKIRSDINKEHDPFRMLDLSLLCISLMTGDQVFYNHNKDKLMRIMCN